jgi:hypothetical protein
LERRISSVETHGIPIEIDWGKFQIGTSIFIPGVDQDGLKRQIRWEMRRLRLKVVIKGVVENDILGVRTWRVP